MIGVLKRLWRKTPEDVAYALKRRLLGESAADRIRRTLRDPKHMRSQRVHDFLHRHELILGRVTGWRPLDFQGATVLELGCGPVLGWGPLAVQRGAARFIAFEPDYEPGIWEHEAFAGTYLRAVHGDLSAIHGPAGDFESFRRSLAARTVVHTVPFTTATAERADTPVSIVLSNSVLEHVADFEDFVASLARVCAPGARMLHAVDLANHRSKTDPFGGLYDRPGPEARARLNDEINLLKRRDMVEALKAHGFEAQSVPYIEAPHLVPEPVHPWWRERYDISELAEQVVLIHATKR